MLKTHYVLESKLWEYNFDHLIGSVKSLSNCDMTDLMFGGWCGDISERTGLDMKTQGFGIDTSFGSR